MARECGVADAVTFTGGVPAAELPAYYLLGDVFAMPCRTRGAGLDVEGLGIVFLEASAAGCRWSPATRRCPETVVHNRTGLVVDGRAVDQIADAVAGLLADPARAAAMGAAGREWATGHWRWDSLAGRMAELLQA